MGQIAVPTPAKEDAASQSLVAKLVRWYERTARDLPWRRTSDPYAIWISEVMLQQTQVRTVIPYWERWMQELPNVSALAKAPFARVLKLWEGLGYYTRARLLHRAAETIVNEHGGAFPTDYKAVLALPGIGRYTAGAVCSIAFNQPVPILDGNVIRVLARLFAIGGNPQAPNVNQKLWRKAEELVRTASTAGALDQACSRVNQALMELGALVCTPKQPRCTECPLNDQCIAFRTRRVERLPAIPRRAKPTPRYFCAFVVAARDKLLLRQRPAGVVNAHMWEFPNIEHLENDNSPAPLAERCLGCTPSSLIPLTTFQHSITRFRIQLRAFWVRANSGKLRIVEAGEWYSPAEIEGLALPNAHRRILLAIKASNLHQASRRM